MQVSTEVHFTKLYLPFVRKNFSPLRPALSRRTSVSFRFFFLSNSNPLTLGFEFDLVFHNCCFSVIPLGITPSVALLSFFPLFSFQGAD